MKLDTNPTRDRGLQMFVLSSTRRKCFLKLSDRSLKATNWSSFSKRLTQKNKGVDSHKTETVHHICRIETKICYKICRRLQTAPNLGRLVKNCWKRNCPYLVLGLNPYGETPAKNRVKNNVTVITDKKIWLDVGQDRYSQLEKVDVVESCFDSSLGFTQILSFPKKIRIIRLKIGCKFGMA